MRIEYSVADLKILNFNYLVQLDNHSEVGDCVFEHGDNPEGFWIGKRLRFISCNNHKACSIRTYYSENHKNMTAERLVEYLNGNKDRYFRPLNKKELEWFSNWQISKRM